MTRDDIRTAVPVDEVEDGDQCFEAFVKASEHAKIPGHLTNTAWIWFREGWFKRAEFDGYS